MTYPKSPSPAIERGLGGEVAVNSNPQTQTTDHTDPRPHSLAGVSNGTSGQAAASIISISSSIISVALPLRKISVTPSV